MNATDAEMGGAATAAEEKPKLSLEVTIESPSDCKRHVIVRIAESDVRRYWNKTCNEMRPTAEVPGFRPGRAPRKLVESRFRKEIEGRVKGNLLLDAVTQVMEESDVAAISEPDFDVEAVIIPDEGPLTFEFDVEVRPEFDLPKWEGLKLKRFKPEITEEQVDEQLQRIKERFSHFESVDRPIEAGDRIDVDITVKHGEETVTELKDQRLPVVSEVVLADATIADFDKLMEGAQKDESRSTRVTIAENAETESLAGQEVEVTFTIRQILATVAPDTDELLDGLGEGFDSEEDVRHRIEDELAEQIDYHNQDAVRKQITTELTKDANWELPDDLIERQTQRELQRTYYELKSRGYPDELIQAKLNRVRQDRREMVATALREHFILERLAEEYEIDAEPEDFDRQIMLIAAQQGISVRRARARLEKRGDLDVIRNQIIEDKVIEMIKEKAEFEDVALEGPQGDEDRSTVGVDLALAGKEKPVIPEARHPEEPQDLRAPKDHT